MMNNVTKSFLCYLIFSVSYCFGQTSRIEETDKLASREQFVDFVMKDNNIIALSTNGILYNIDKKNGNKSRYSTGSDLLFTQLSLDKKQNIILVGTKSVYRLKNSKINKINYSKHEILGLVYDTNNRCYLITKKGIVDTRTSKIYFPNDTLSQSTRKTKEWSTFPPNFPTYKIDQNNKIWIGFDYGEWGGELYVFDTREHKYLKPNFMGFFRPMTSITDANNGVYIASSLAHFTISSSIILYDNLKNETIFSSYTHKKNENDDKLIDGEYIGPIYYTNNNLYFYSQNGFFKGNLGVDLNEFENWKKVFNPNFKWSFGRSNPVGGRMTVNKFIVLDDDEIIFLTQNNGIGIFRNNEITYSN